MKRIITKFQILISVAISTVGSLLYSALAFADSNSALDLSKLYLTKMFGTVGNELHAAAPTVMGLLFNDLNCGVMGIATAIISYTTVRVIIDTAHDGEPLGKKVSHWIVARTCAGIGLLIPKASGYTLLQVGMMGIVLAGVNTANTIWHHTLQYINNGGVIYDNTYYGGDKGDKQIDLDIVVGGDKTSSDSSMDFQAGALSVLRSQVCMLALEEAIHKEQKQLGEDLAEDTSHVNYVPGSTKYAEAKNFSTVPIALTYSLDPQKHMLTFPSAASLRSYPGLAGLVGACGTFRWEWDKDWNAKTGPSGSDAVYANAKTNAVQDILSITTPLAHAILDSKLDPGDKSYQAFSARVRDGLVNAGVSYQAVVEQYRVAKSIDYMSREQWEEKNKTNSTKFIDEADKKGWAAAGQYYYDLIKVQRLTQEEQSGYYHIWSDNDGIQTRAKDFNLVPSPRRIYEGTHFVGNNTAFVGLIKKYKEAKIAEHQLNPNFLETRLTKILDWTFKIRGAISSYVNDFNTIIQKEQLGDGTGGLKIDDDPEFKTFLQRYADSSVPGLAPGVLSEVAITTSVMLPSSLTILAPLNIGIYNAMHRWAYLMRDGGNDTRDPSKPIRFLAPIQTLYSLGDFLITDVVLMWEGMTAAVGALFQVTSVVTSAAGGALAATSVVGLVPVLGAGWVGIPNALMKAFEYEEDCLWKTIEAGIFTALPLALGITAIMFTVGMTMCYYVPFVPYMLFTFGVISWLVFVIEAMTASAVVALGLMDPRAGGGDEVFGRAEPAIHLSMAVFLRPSTMLIGLIAGTMLSYVGLSLLNNTFAGFIHSFMFADNSGLLYSNFKFIGMMFVYNLIVVSLIVKCYECIYTIPDQIMQWVAGHTRPSTDGQFLHDFGHKVAQFGGEVSSTATRTTEAAAQSILRSRSNASQARSAVMKIMDKKDSKKDEND